MALRRGGAALEFKRGPGGARQGCRASSLFYCRTGRCYIFLDLHRDRYLTLEADRVESAGGLAAHPLLCKAVGPPAIPLPASSVFEAGVGPRHRIGLTENFRFFWCVTWADWRLRMGELEKTVAIVDRRKRESHTSISPFDFDKVRALLDAFEGLRPWFPRNHLCLFDSLALLTFLARYALYPTWVFGVQEEPFEAHCWLQAGDVVLNDSLERVSAFTPIMAV